MAQEPVIYWDNYWRCEVKRCTNKDCGNVRPLAEFHKCLRNKCGYSSWCKNCDKVKTKRYVRRNRRRVAEYHVEWAGANKDRIVGYQKDYRERHKARNKERVKQHTYAREERHGISDWHRIQRTSAGRLVSIWRQVRRSYIPGVSIAEIRARYTTDTRYLAQFKRWQDSGFSLSEAPVVYSDRPEPTLQDLVVVKFGKIRSVVTKRAWKEGDYEKRKGRSNGESMPPVSRQGRQDGV